MTFLRCWLVAVVVIVWVFGCATTVADEKPSSSSLCGSNEVLIVGAGFAGLAAAKELKDSAFTNFRIVEATNRIGGRASTVQPPNFDGIWVEEGANWIEEGNPIWDLAVKYKKDFTLQEFYKYEVFTVDEKVCVICGLP